jgi:hypothetical protein
MGRKLTKVLAILLFSVGEYLLIYLKIHDKWHFSGWGVFFGAMIGVAIVAAFIAFIPEMISKFIGEL